MTNPEKVIIDTKPILMEKKKRGNRWILHLFPLPALLVYGLFVVYPLFAALSYSFYSWQGFTKGAFIGLENFRKLFVTEPFSGLFWNALQHNILYFVIEMIVQNGIAFLLAYALYKRIRGTEFFKIAFFLPRLLSVIVVGFLWKLILNPNFGALNKFLDSLGLSSWKHAWLGEPETALISIILVNCWFGIGFATLIFLAGLQNIPAELVEAAKLDGATGWTLLRKIIVPLVMPSITIMTVLTFIQSFEAFELVYAMQGSMGEPYYSTDTLAVYFYRLAFGSGSSADSSALGLGSALAVVLFAMIAIITSILMKFMRRFEVEQ